MRLVISQAEEVSNIALPMFMTRLAIQIAMNAAWPNGPHAEGAGSVGAAERSKSMLKLVS